MVKGSPKETPAGLPRLHRYLRVLLGRIRSAVAYVWNATEAALHTRRRLRTVEALRALPSLRRVVFICYGNVCRSPFAAAAYRRALRSGTTIPVLSAGFVGPERRPPDQALKAASERGIDMRDHRSTVVNHRVVLDADLIAVMSADQARALRNLFGRTRGAVVVLGDLDPLPIRTRTIVDPWGADDAIFDESYDRIERCVQELARVTQAAHVVEPHQSRGVLS